jgi:hypothetical protein
MPQSDRTSSRLPWLKLGAETFFVLLGVLLVVPLMYEGPAKPILHDSVAFEGMLLRVYDETERVIPSD